MGFAIDRLGERTEEKEFTVEPERTKAYAAATNDPIPAHSEGELAPPVFAIVPIWEANAEAVVGVVPAEVMLQVVHGEQDMTFHRPIKPGDVLHSNAAVVGVQVKPSGTTTVVKAETRDAKGKLVVEQHMTAFFRGISDGENAGEAAPSHKLTNELKAGEPVATVAQKLDDDQTFRYAEASGDYMPVHLDDDVAKSVGLPGIIIHGLCTMAFTSWAVIRELAAGDPSRLRRLAVRFSQPVLPGQEISTRFWHVGEHEGNAVYGFETTNPDGDTVIKNGLAEVST